jgi:hypothetical protein
MANGEYIGYLVGLLGAAGGLGSYLRARSQNKTDAGRLVFEQQNAFTASLSTEVARLSALVQLLGADKDKLEQKLSDQGLALERLRTLDEVKTSQIEGLQRQNLALVERADAQQREIAALQGENSSIGTQLAVAIAAKSFLEGENSELRREVSNLRGLPVPTTVVGAHGES